MFGTIIKELRKQKKLTQSELANNLSISKSKVAMWETNQRDPVKDDLILLSNFFGISIDELLGNTYRPKENFFDIPVFSNISDGNSLFTNDKIVYGEEIPIEYKGKGDFFALKVKDKSMEPRFCEGDIVIVRRQNDVEDGDFAIVLVDGDEITFKQIKKSEAGITLIGINTSVYLPHFYSNDDIKSLPVSIIGKVVEARIKF